MGYDEMIHEDNPTLTEIHNLRKNKKIPCILTVSQTGVATYSVIDTEGTIYFAASTYQAAKDKLAQLKEH